MISWNWKILRKPITSLICGQYWSRQSQVIQLLTAAGAAGSLIYHHSCKFRNHCLIRSLCNHQTETNFLFLSVWNRLRDDLDTILMSERAWERHWRRAGAGTGCYWSPPTRLEKLGEETAAACLLPWIQHYTKTTIIQYNEAEKPRINRMISSEFWQCLCYSCNWEIFSYRS